MTDLTQVQATLIQLIGSLPEPPRRLRLSAGDVTVELDWPDRPQPLAAPQGTAARPANGAAPSPATSPATSVAASAAGNPAASAAGNDAHQVCSPSVGTFYRAPEPGAAPFVNEGDLVRAGQQIAIVEAMKLMLPVEADRPGRVTAVLKADGEQVEYAEPLVSLALAEDQAGVS